MGVVCSGREIGGCGGWATGNVGWRVMVRHGWDGPRGVCREVYGGGRVGDDSGEDDRSEGVEEVGLVKSMPWKGGGVWVVEVDEGVEDDGNTAVIVVGLGNCLLVDDGLLTERRVGGIVVVEEVEPGV